MSEGEVKYNVKVKRGVSWSERDLVIDCESVKYFHKGNLRFDMKISDIDFHECFIKIFGKGSKERIVPIGEYAMYYLKYYIDNYRNDFLRDKESEYISADLYIKYKNNP